MNSGVVNGCLTRTLAKIFRYFSRLLEILERMVRVAYQHRGISGHFDHDIRGLASVYHERNPAFPHGSSGFSKSLRWPSVVDKFCERGASAGGSDGSPRWRRIGLAEAGSAIATCAEFVPL